MPLTDAQRNTAMVQTAHNLRVERQEGEGAALAAAASVSAGSRRGRRGEETPPAAYIVGATCNVAFDSGVLRLSAGRRLDAVEDAALIGDLQRLGDVRLIPSYD